jgi:hypothetical protein
MILSSKLNNEVFGTHQNFKVIFICCCTKIQSCDTIGSTCVAANDMSCIV